jgi:hypothetical protein
VHASGVSAATPHGASGNGAPAYAVPLPTPPSASFPVGYAGLKGTVTLAQRQDAFGSALFTAEGVLSTSSFAGGACPSGDISSEVAVLDNDIVLQGNMVVKAPVRGVYALDVDFPLPQPLSQPSNCLVLVIGGTGTPSSPLVGSFDLDFYYTQQSAGSLVPAGGGYCFGQSAGCQGSTTDYTKSFASVFRVGSAGTLTALWGTIADSSLNSTPMGPWTATNDFYVYHDADCAALETATGNGAGDYYASIPSTAIPLLSEPLSASGVAVAQVSVYKPLAVSVVATDCVVTLFGMSVPSQTGVFDDESQIQALLGP